MDETKEVENISYDVKETKEVLKLLIELGEGLEKAFADKKFEISEIALLITPLMFSTAALEGIALMPKEIKDMDAAEFAEIKEYIEVELDLENDKIELIIEKAIGLAMNVMNFVSLFKK